MGLLCLADAYFVEPRWPEVVTVRLHSAKLPAGAQPLRLAFIADFHSEAAVRLEPRLPDLIAALKPDAIVFGGDAVNAEAGLPHFIECMRRLAALAPTFAVRGNWEVWWFPRLDLFGGTGVQVLEGDAVAVQAAATKFWIAGSGVENESVLPAALARIPKDCFAVCVHHFPVIAERALALGADLALAGDTHGGQVRLPGLGALARIHRLGGAYYECGLHRCGTGWLYVNRGIGMEGGIAPRLRFLCRPEVTLFEIGPAARD
jgi:hypothetical protein